MAHTPFVRAVADALGIENPESAEQMLAEVDRRIALADAARAARPKAKADPDDDLYAALFPDDPISPPTAAPAGTDDDVYAALFPDERKRK